MAFGLGHMGTGLIATLLTGLIAALIAVAVVLIATLIAIAVVLIATLAVIVVSGVVKALLGGGQ